MSYSSVQTAVAKKDTMENNVKGFFDDKSNTRKDYAQVMEHRQGGICLTHELRKLSNFTHVLRIDAGMQIRKFKMILIMIIFCSLVT